MEDLSNVSCRNCHLESTNSLAWAQTHRRHPSPGAMAVASEGRRLFVALPEMDEVVEIDVARLQVVRRTSVSGEPSGLALAPDGSSLFVACRGADRVVRVDLVGAAFTEVESVTVGIQPVGIACSADGTNGLRVVVANLFSEDASLLVPGPWREATRFSTGREPRGVGFSADGQLAYVVSRLATRSATHPAPVSEMTVFDPGTGRVVQRGTLESAHLAESIAAVPGRSWVLAPMVRVRNLVPITQVARGWVMSSGLAVMTPDGAVVQVPIDEANRYFADPGGLVVSPDGRLAYIASGGGDAVSVVDLDRLARWLEQADDASRRMAIHDLELSGDYVVGRIPTGRNPQSLALSPDGARLFVAERLDDAILVVDTGTREPVGRVALGDGGLSDPVRRGERWFTWAGENVPRPVFLSILPSGRALRWIDL